MNSSGQRGLDRPRTRGTDRSVARRAELIAVGRKLFADRSYDALSMDDIAKQAQVAKGLIYYYFQSKRGYYLAIVEDAVADLTARAADGLGLPPEQRVHRTVDGYLRFAEHHQAAYRTIISGGVGFDSEVQAIRDGVREAIITTIAEGAWGPARTDRAGSGAGRQRVRPLPRAALLAWLCSVEGATLDWIDRQDLTRDTMRELLVKMLGGALRAVEELDPSYVAPAAARRDG
ncbi:TetR/AcrR family transcriptional regulator [Streptomyces sp. NPDC005551]|uniref:TetR/AcrR family transcriptional regulator n=1 Tax=unclassified Streptomyces TaxID=2593676 RepID=UPI0033F1F291